ncbi:hypothetical protein OPT61_g1130 [Boeremia exigua]|uniref:Uncharacterized protein n=1 Tax=Boeremia exigua TaxID=749465 RepID=A0ACC2IRA2_9PLEO|nr:hypothetical protein OPT61_g1130 [Boeremia exigua]
MDRMDGVDSLMQLLNKDVVPCSSMCAALERHMDAGPAGFCALTACSRYIYRTVGQDVKILTVGVVVRRSNLTVGGFNYMQRSPNLIQLTLACAVAAHPLHVASSDHNGILCPEEFLVFCPRGAGRLSLKSTPSPHFAKSSLTKEVKKWIMTAKTVLITGCSAGGIGPALVNSFQSRGYFVYATARSLTKMADLASLPNVHLLELDVVNPVSIAAVAKEIEAHTGGRLDVLVNNAGQQYIMPALDVNIETAKNLFDVNYWGPLRMIQSFGEMLIRAEGCVVNIGSIAGVVNVPFQSQYGATKTAVSMLSETLRFELAPLKVRVITVVAGSVTSLLSSGVNGSPPTELPPTSYYRPIEKEIAKHQQFANMETTKFADGVVSAVVSRATGNLYMGTNAGIAKWLVPILPSFIYDRIVISMGRGIDKMP